MSDTDGNAARKRPNRPTILTPGHIQLIHLLAAQAAEGWLKQHTKEAINDASRDLRPL